MVDIFAEVGTGETRNYFKFATVGDRIQGTYIKRDDGTKDSYQNPQTLVDLLTEDGTIKTVSIRHNKTGLLDELDKCNIGDIIGFVFNGTKENPGKQATKFIKLIHDSKFRDEAWLKAQEGQENPTAGMTPETLFRSAPAAQQADPMVAALEASLTAPAVTVRTDTDKIKEIASLVKTKFGAVTSEDIKSIIMEKTGLPFLPMNLDNILVKLNSI